jgi:hypothetical protein
MRYSTKHLCQLRRIALIMLPIADARINQESRSKSTPIIGITAIQAGRYDATMKMQTLFFGG